MNPERTEEEKIGGKTPEMNRIIRLARDHVDRGERVAKEAGRKFASKRRNLTETWSGLVATIPTSAVVFVGNKKAA